MTQRQKSSSVRAAVIGLIGTLLTMCGGLTGAAVSAAVTVYRVEREAKQVALAPPGSGQALTVDTQQIAKRYEEAMGLDTDDYYVVPELGFVLAQPREGWSGVEERWPRVTRWPGLRWIGDQSIVAVRIALSLTREATIS